MTCRAGAGSEHNMNFLFLSLNIFAISRIECSPALLM